jgi:hypothetical protein
MHAARLLGRLFFWITRKVDTVVTGSDICTPSAGGTGKRVAKPWMLSGPPLSCYCKSLP